MIQFGLAKGMMFGTAFPGRPSSMGALKVADKYCFEIIELHTPVLCTNVHLPYLMSFKSLFDPVMNNRRISTLSDRSLNDMMVRVAMVPPVNKTPSPIVLNAVYKWNELLAHLSNRHKGYSMIINDNWHVWATDRVEVLHTGDVYDPYTRAIVSYANCRVYPTRITDETVPMLIPDELEGGTYPFHMGLVAVLSRLDNLEDFVLRISSGYLAVIVPTATSYSEEQFSYSTIFITAMEILRQRGKHRMFTVLAHVSASHGYLFAPLALLYATNQMSYTGNNYIRLHRSIDAALNEPSQATKTNIYNEHAYHTIPGYKSMPVQTNFTVHFKMHMMHILPPVYKLRMQDSLWACLFLATAMPTYRLPIIGTEVSTTPVPRDCIGPLIGPCTVDANFTEIELDDDNGEVEVYSSAEIVVRPSDDLKNIVYSNGKNNDEDYELKITQDGVNQIMARYRSGTGLTIRYSGYGIPKDATIHLLPDDRVVIRANQVEINVDDLRVTTTHNVFSTKTMLEALNFYISPMINFMPEQLRGSCPLYIISQMARTMAGPNSRADVRDSTVIKALADLIRRPIPSVVNNYAFQTMFGNASSERNMMYPTTPYEMIPYEYMLACSVMLPGMFEISGDTIKVYDVTGYIEFIAQRTPVQNSPLIADGDVDLSSLKLLKHQIHAINEMIRTGNRFNIIRLSPGAGKTRAILAFHRLCRQNFTHVMWFGPASAKSGVMGEIMRVTGVECSIYATETVIQPGGVYFVEKERFARAHDVSKFACDCQGALFIIDELHAYTIDSVAFSMIVPGISHARKTVSMTGTLFANSQINGHLRHYMTLLARYPINGEHGLYAAMSAISYGVERVSQVIHKRYKSAVELVTICDLIKQGKCVFIVVKTEKAAKAFVESIYNTVSGLSSTDIYIRTSANTHEMGSRLHFEHPSIPFGHRIPGQPSIYFTTPRHLTGYNMNWFMYSFITCNLKADQLVQARGRIQRVDNLAPTIWYYQSDVVKIGGGLVEDEEE